eukprot:scaffold101_cov373-Prasinococcus_capsulatus_cf.AAC.15
MTEQAVRAFIDLLQREGKHAEALEYLEGPFGDTINIETNKKLLKAQLQMDLKQYSEAAKTFEAILVECPDDWRSFWRFLDALSLEHSITSKDTTESALALLRKMSNTLPAEGRHNALRGPRLGCVELYYRQLKALLSNEADAHAADRSFGDTATAFQEAFVAYVEEFAHLPCICPDLRLYVVFLNEQAELADLRQLVVSKLEGRLRTLDFPENLRELEGVPLRETRKVARSRIGHIELLQILEFDKGLPKEHAIARVNELVTLYDQLIPLSVDIDEREAGLADELLGIASNIFVDLYIREQREVGGITYLLSAALILERLVSRSKYSYVHNLRLCSLYLLMGVPQLAYNAYRRCDIKNIQLDTLSHFFLYGCISACAYNSAAELCQDVTAFVQGFNKDSADLVFHAFNHGSYTKAIEMLDFKTRLDNSHAYAAALAEARVLEIKLGGLNVPSVCQILAPELEGAGDEVLVTSLVPSQLSCNEDLTYRPWWHQSPWSHSCALLPNSAENTRDVCWGTRDADASDDMQKEWFARLGTRRLLPRVVALSLVPGSNSECLARHVRTYESLLEDLHQGLAALEDTPYDKINPLLSSCLMERQLWRTSAAVSEGLATLSNAVVEELQILKSRATVTARSILWLWEDRKENGGEGAHPQAFAVSATQDFAGETLHWTSLCLQAWSRALKAKRKNARKKQDIGEHVEDATALEQCLSVLRELRTLLLDLLSDLDGILSAKIRISTDQYVQTAHGLTANLVGSCYARKFVAAFATERSKAMQQLQEHLSATSEELSSAAF